MALQSIGNGEFWLDIRGKLNSMFSELYGGKLDKNTTITGATKTKITYDDDGLVIGGADAGISDITGLQTALNGKLPSTNTKAQFDTACTDDNFAFLGQANTFNGEQTIDGIFRKLQRTDIGAPNSLKFGTRYELAGIAHGSQGHIMEVLRGDTSSTNGEGSGNDGGRGIQFGPNGNPYLKMIGESVSIGRVGGDLTVNGQNRTSGWTSFTLTTSMPGGTINSTAYVKYKQIGKTVHFAIKANVSQTGGNNYFTFNPPVSIVSGYQGGLGSRWFSAGWFASGAFIADGVIYIQGGSTMVNDVFIGGSYEAA